ncbi:MAG TPA: hypothetical protein VGR96_16200, partial [Acidobacteriaceae bacterium]|nr:hypothetical protein [Acidobacteriaceae bacterium]
GSRFAEDDRPAEGRTGLAEECTCAVEFEAQTGLPAGTDRRFSVLHVLLALSILIVGAVEGWYKRALYSTDAISYLDISKAIPRHDWKMVFNALWSPGYPLLIALIRPLFPANAPGEWTAIHVLNLCILLFAWIAFLFLLRSVQPGLSSVSASERRSQGEFLLLAGYSIFLCAEIGIDGPSRISPDPLVDGLFFAAIGASIRMIRLPSAARGTLLGVILGAGYWVKTIFLPVSVVVLIVTGCALLMKRRRLRSAILAAAVWSTLVLPLAAGISWSLGRPTFGESGALNYAFHVNLLPHYTNWQGGPAENGRPIHPTRMLLKDPPLFEFAGPFHNTYPPFGNAVYWYEGYRHFWSARYQAAAIARNLFYLALLLARQPLAYAILGIFAVLLLRPSFRRAWTPRVRSCWPIFLPALLAIGMYVASHLEDRYLAGYLATLAVVPFAALSALQPELPRRRSAIILSVLALAAAASLATADRAAFAAALHHKAYSDDPEWRLAAYLREEGLQPGDKVGAIGGPNAECTWAYVDGLRIVAELGGLPYDPHPGPHAHWWSNRKQNPDSSAEDFWRSSAETQASILKLFQGTGAVAVIAPARSPQANAPGWKSAPGSGVWVYHF